MVILELYTYFFVYRIFLVIKFPKEHNGETKKMDIRQKIMVQAEFG